MLSLCFAFMLQDAAAQATAQATAQQEVTVAATKFAAGLSQHEKHLACTAFDDPKRVEWNYLPGERLGARLNELDASSRDDLNALLWCTLSANGVKKMCAVRDLEAFLSKAQPERYNKDWYEIALFGDPSTAGKWGFRFEGHHLSLNFTSGDAGGQPSIFVTPMFLGAAPFEVPSASHTGDRPLAQERELAFALLRSLTPEQRAIAVVGAVAPGEIASNGASAKVDPSAGIACARLSESQRAALVALIKEYADRLRGEFAQSELARAREAGLDSIHFAWRGSQDESAPHYYSIAGPTLVIEFACTSGSPDHVHTVWRDPQHDFGVNALQEHLKSHHGEAGSPVPPPK